jgi:hypothetical protein
LEKKNLIIIIYYGIFHFRKNKNEYNIQNIIAFNNLDDEEKELDEKTKNKLIEI